MVRIGTLCFRTELRTAGEGSIRVKDMSSLWLFGLRGFCACLAKCACGGPSPPPRVDVSEHLSGPAYCDSRTSRLGGGDNCHEQGSDKHIS